MIGAEDALGIAVWGDNRLSGSHPVRLDGRISMALIGESTASGLPQRVFNWVIFDTPPLLFSADANLLATLADGTILVVKIGAATFDNVTRAMQTLCENNGLGVVANGARASERYSTYTYYYSKSESGSGVSGIARRGWPAQGYGAQLQ